PNPFESLERVLVVKNRQKADTLASEGWQVLLDYHVDSGDAAVHREYLMGLFGKSADSIAKREVGAEEKQEAKTIATSERAKDAPSSSTLLPIEDKLVGLPWKPADRPEWPDASWLPSAEVPSDIRSFLEAQRNHSVKIGSF